MMYSRDYRVKAARKHSVESTKGFAAAVLLGLISLGCWYPGGYPSLIESVRKQIPSRKADIVDTQPTDSVDTRPTDSVDTRPTGFWDPHRNGVINPYQGENLDRLVEEARDRASNRDLYEPLWSLASAVYEFFAQIVWIKWTLVAIPHLLAIAFFRMGLGYAKVASLYLSGSDSQIRTHEENMGAIEAVLAERASRNQEREEEKRRRHIERYHETPEETEERRRKDREESYRQEQQESERRAEADRRRAEEEESRRRSSEGQISRYMRGDGPP